MSRKIYRRGHDPGPLPAELVGLLVLVGIIRLAIEYWWTIIIAFILFAVLCGIINNKQ